jgi:hypothetical protein
MKYFITGATGFIGGRLARQLREEGHEVVAVVRNPAKAQDLAQLGVILHQGDVTEKESMRVTSIPLMNSNCSLQSTSAARWEYPSSAVCSPLFSSCSSSLWSGNWSWLGWFILLENLFLFTLQVFIPLSFNNGGTILKNLRRKSS